MSDDNSKQYAQTLLKVQLKKLGFLEIHSVLHLENYAPGEMDIDIKNEVQFPKTDEVDKYAVLDKYKITGNINNKAIFDIDTTMVVVLESKEKIGTDFLTTFSKTNCKLITYPYLRQTVQDLTSKMGLPVLSLPIWQSLTSFKEDKKELTGETSITPPGDDSSILH